ncbi:L-threonine 3-dehydrogenase [soil metagenome]
MKSRPEPGVDICLDVDSPEALRDNEIRIKVNAASVCGTDRELYNYSPAAVGFKLTFPVVLGHEGAGTVTETGRSVTAIEVGDRIALDSHIACLNCYPCRSGDAHLCANMRLLGLHTNGVFAEECVVDVNAAFKLPEAFPLDDAALLEPAGVAMHAIQRYGSPLLSKRVLITGGGPVGLFIAELARIAGAAKVVVVEPNPFRQNFASTLGAEAIDPSSDVVGMCRDIGADRGGFDVGFEASGHADGFGTILDSLRVGGTHVSVGFSRAPNQLDTAEYLNRRAITLVGSFGRRLWDTWDAVVTLVASGQLDLSRFITHRVGLDDFESAISLLSQDSCKVLVIPSMN